MARYIVGFDGKWHESFADAEEAICWAEEMAGTGRVVEGGHGGGGHGGHGGH